MPSISLTASIDELLEAAVQAGTGFYTGRHIVTFKAGAQAEATQLLGMTASMRVAMTSDFDNHAVDFAALGDAGSLVFPEIGAAVVLAPDGDGATLANALSIADTGSPVQTIEPETFVFPSSESWQAYLRGFAAAADRIRDDLTGDLGALPQPGPVPHAEVAAANATWGIVATRAAASRFSGQGIKVAMLDTGFDFAHPDFNGRPFTSQSFIVGQTPQDGHGHGSHTAGTACGPQAPVGVPRYGTAYGSQIFIGKVLSNQGSGATASVLAGMNWAITNRCQVISMSLGAPTGVQTAYTQAGQAALNAGCLIIAATGNDSRRPGTIAPTGAPGNSPTILAVAALDQNLQVAFFSNGGKVNICGPGVNVFSSYKMPQRYATLAGTSMATPHVAGAAALWAQSNPTLRGPALWTALTQHARHLPLPATDVGAGLVQCP